MELARKIKKLMYDSLSGDQVLSICDNKANIITYPKLVEFDNIDDVLGEYGACIILYQTTENYGHFTCIFKEDSKTIQHFDSYGYKPDQELKFIKTNFRKENNEWYPHLTYLLYKSGYRITYNEYKLQKKNTTTCGRWCGARILLRKYPLKKFVKFFEGGGKYDTDFIVTLYTYLKQTSK